MPGGSDWIRQGQTAFQSRLAYGNRGRTGLNEVQAIRVIDPRFAVTAQEQEHIVACAQSTDDGEACRTGKAGGKNGNLRPVQLTQDGR